MLHVFTMCAVFFPLLRRQEGHRLALAFNAGKQKRPFRFFQLIDLRGNRREVGLLIVQERLQLEVGNLDLAFHFGFSSLEIQLHGFELADLLRRQADLFGMFEQVFQVMPGMLVRALLLMAALRVAMHHHVSMARLRPAGK